MQRRTWISFVILFVVSARGYCAFELKPHSFRMAGMGGVSAAASDEIDGIFSNPAALFLTPSPQSGLTHTTLFGIKELAYSNISFAYPNRWGTFGVGIGQFGGSIYTEKEVVLSWAKGVWFSTAIGATLKYMEVDIPTVGVGKTGGVDFGLLHKVGDKMRIGFFWANMNSPRIVEPLPRRVVSGISIRPIDRMVVGVDFEVSITPHLDHRSSWMVGLEFGVTEGFFVRSGLRTDPPRPAFGFGLGRRWGRFDYAYLYHEILGGTHGVSIILRFGKR